VEKFSRTVKDIDNITPEFHDNKFKPVIKQLIRLGDKLAHTYDELDFDVLYDTVTPNFPIYIDFLKLNEFRDNTEFCQSFSFMFPDNKNKTVLGQNIIKYNGIFSSKKY
jgi:hypothetical protein